MFGMIFGIIESEKLRARQNPDLYEDAREYLQEEAYQNIDTDFFAKNELPVDPSWFLEKLYGLRQANTKQSLLHTAINVHCA